MTSEQTTSNPDLLSMDPALLKQFKIGDPSALTRVYKGYLTDLMAFLKRGFAFNAQGNRYFFNGYKEPWHLENGVQEVFIKAFKENARLAYDGMRPFRNYLFRIARNTVLDDFRSRRGALDVRTISADDETTGEPETLPADPEVRLWDKELREAVRQFVEELNGLRPFFEARFTRGGSVESCAKLLGWSEYRVKREEKRMRKQFFSYLKARGYFDGYCFENHQIRAATLTVLLCCMGGIS